jgi:hypothetical protein
VNFLLNLDLLRVAGRAELPSPEILRGRAIKVEFKVFLQHFFETHTSDLTVTLSSQKHSDCPG